MKWLERLTGGRRPGSAAGGRTALRIVVGLDNGTALTKIALSATTTGRGAREERVAIPLWGQACSPSVVYLDGDRVGFGEAPSPRAVPFRSLKMALRRAAAAGAAAEPLVGGRLPLRAAIHGYLGAVVAEIRREIDARWPADRFDRTIDWHMGVPMDPDLPRVESAFADALYQAVHGPTVQGRVARVDDVIARHEEARRLTRPPASEAACDCFALAEAAVAVNAILALRGALEPGNYFICDVGAGTIDTAFFWYSEESDKPISFYGLSSHACGGDDFVKAAVEHLRAAAPTATAEELHQQAVRRLEAGRFEEEAFGAVLDGLRKGRFRAFGRSLKKEPLDRWEESQPIGAYLIGGGRHLPGVPGACLGAVATPIAGHELATYAKHVPITSVPGATDLHGIAIGLSIPIVRFIPYAAPVDVPPTPPRAEPLPPPKDWEDRDDKWW